MDSLYVSALYENGQYMIDVNTFIILTIYQNSIPCSLRLKINILENDNNKCIAISFNDIKFDIVHNIPELAQMCTLPVIFLNSQIVSGLCSVARQICKKSHNENSRKLLGFREACLMACAESSVWTKFCEIDMVQTINHILSQNLIQENCFNLPEDVLKFENHLKQPVRIHNIYKIARTNHKDQRLTSSTPQKDLRVLHDFAEGPYATLADLILYPSFQILLKYLEDLHSVASTIPLTIDWMNRLKKSGFSNIKFTLNIVPNIGLYDISVPIVNNVSLYNADPLRSPNIKHTKQYKIESAVSLLNGILKDIKNEYLPFGHDQVFNWDDIPLDINPKGGSLPAKRASRKCEQLENLAKAVIKIVDNRKCRIVDFCSGSGHLGILISFLLPNCTVVLVENKERSLERARATILKLNLVNIIIVQSNLDYFVGQFDLGLALHACGVATDLVLQMCIKNKADFVCCPCCYGGIKDCHEVMYPRSVQYKDIFHNFKSHYFNLAHAADQTHEQDNAKTEQGYFCMDVIDTDRKYYTESYGYRVYLGKLQPVTCTNKNNLLVGICCDRENL